MKNVWDDAQKCCGCGACMAICPKNAIVMRRDEEGFLYPRIDEEACIGCGLCEKRCPAVGVQTQRRGRALAAYNRDEGVREASSSGGVFTALAQQVLSQGGVGFGAAFDEDLQLSHVGVMSEKELAHLRGSKYLQSDASEVLRSIGALARLGTQVLFVGTPCQAAGVRAVLGQEMENVLIVDIVCHGVPSPGMFESYIRMLEKERGAKVLTYAFRDKLLGWKNFSVAARFADGSEYTGTQTEDPFMRSFLNNLCLRPSCAQCPYAGYARTGDLTLADLWGAQKHLKDWDDDKGLSLVFVNTGSGSRAMRAIEGKIKTTAVDPKKYLPFNPSIESACTPHARRARFIAAVNREGFSEALVDKMLAPPTFLERAVGKARRVTLRLRRMIVGKTEP